MCFRPSTTEATIKCPNCGRAIHQVLGDIPGECPFCDADLSELVAAVKGEGAAMSMGMGMPSAPSTPGAPKMPGAPSMPGAPKMPGVPKMPGAPKMP